MELSNIFLGTHSGPVWVSGIIWALAGIALVKIYYYKPRNKFSLKFWVNDNLKDISLGLLATLLLLRIGDVAILILALYMPSWAGILEGVNDSTIVVIIASVYIQVKLHKRGSPISTKLKSQMKKQNLDNDLL